MLQGGITLRFALDAVRQVLAALQHLHSLGILHRDLRAANVLVTPGGQAEGRLTLLLADFGVSHLQSTFDCRAGGARPTDPSSKVVAALRGGAAQGPMQVRVVLKVHASIACLFF
jgi:serine/threonine protein kinase